MFLYKLSLKPPFYKMVMGRPGLSTKTGSTLPLGKWSTRIVKNWLFLVTNHGLRTNLGRALSLGETRCDSAPIGLQINQGRWGKKGCNRMVIINIINQQSSLEPIGGVQSGCAPRLILIAVCLLFCAWALRTDSGLIQCKRNTSNRNGSIIRFNAPSYTTYCLVNP